MSQEIDVIPKQVEQNASNSEEKTSATQNADKQNNLQKENEQKQLVPQAQKAEVTPEKAPEHDQLRTPVQNFHAQLIHQWSNIAWGGAVEITYGDVAKITVTHNEQGKPIVVFPNTESEEPLTFAGLLTVVEDIAPEFDGSQATRIEGYARNLRDAAIYLSQQKRSDGTSFINDKTVLEIYNTGVKMALAMNKKANVKAILSRA